MRVAGPTVAAALTVSHVISREYKTSDISIVFEDVEIRPKWLVRIRDHSRVIDVKAQACHQASLWMYVELIKRAGDSWILLVKGNPQ